MSELEEKNIQEKINHQEEQSQQDYYQGEHHHHHHHDYEGEHHHHHHHHHHEHQDLNSGYFRKSSPRRKRDRIQKLIFLIVFIIAIAVILFALWVTEQTN